MTTRLQIYETDTIRVTFDPNVCIHSAVCLRGLPGVFDVRRKQWIDLDRGTAEAVAEVIRRCPSGALQYQMPGERSMSDPTDTASTTDTDVRVEFIKDGPVKVTGGITLVTEDGATERQERVFLCRCGGSARKPLCDGTHKRNGFSSSR